MPLTLDPELFKAFAFYGTLVLGKTLIMSFLTSRHRFAKKVFANPEDGKHLKGSVVKLDDQDVERVRRAHLNDMENVFPFVMLGLIYCCTQPVYNTALWHFRVFAAARFLHTFVYLNQVPQPSRGLAFGVGWAVCASMVVQILMKTF